MGLLRTIRLRSIVGPVAGAAGTLDTTFLDVLDMQGYEGVMFLAHVGLTTSVVSMNAYGSNSTAGLTVLAAGSTTVVVNTTVNNRLLALDVYKPPYRYISCGLGSTNAGNIVGVTAIQYGGHVVPSTQNSTDVASEMHAFNTT